MKLNLKIVAASAAVAMMSSGAAFAAATIVTAPATNTYSKEGLALSGTNAVTLPTITVTFGNNLTYQDDILITLPGTTSVAPTITAGLVTCAGATANAVGYVQLVPGGWNFRVTDVGGITIGASCTFTGLQVTAASLANASGAKLTYQANRGLTVPTVIVDGPVTTATGVVVASQFAITTQQKLNGIIDVYTDRKTFFDAESVCPGGNLTTAPACVPPATAPFTQNDTLNFSTFTLGNPVVGTWSAPTVTPTAAVVTITGDFSWVDGADTNATCFDAGEAAASLIGFAGWTVGATSNCQQLVLNQTAPIADSTVTGYFRIPGNKVLSATDYVGNIEWTYGLTATPTTTGKTGLAWDPGAWTINGAQVYIQYMPYGTGLSRIIYAANDGVLNPEVTADITANGTTFSCSLGTAPAKTVTSLSGVIDSCVAAKGITTGKVAILLTFIAPDQDIEVYSAYNAGGTDRGTVVNTSNGRSFFYGTGVTFP
jgi:hypothetical protein